MSRTLVLSAIDVPNALDSDLFLSDLCAILSTGDGGFCLNSTLVLAVGFCYGGEFFLSGEEGIA